jgi:hypothetical protein
LKTIKLLFTGLLLSSAIWAQAQTPAPEAAPALDAAPPALAEPPQNPETGQAVPGLAPAVFNRKPQFSMAMGSQFSRFGHAAFLQPTVSLPITPRFQAFASVQFLHTFGQTFYAPGAEGGFLAANTRGQQSYVVMAGGNYALNEKWNFTGSIWRDFSQMKGMAQHPVNLFSPAGSQGMMFRAQYKVNDRFSVSGGVRYGNGSGYNGYHHSLYQPYNSPFGF